MFEKFRHNSTPELKYNDTADYEYLEITGILGAFTTQRIALDTLPEGFLAFTLSGKQQHFDRIAPASRRQGDGLFICKEAQAAGLSRMRLNPEDCVFPADKPFDFNGYFGHKLSIDCMIHLADEKRLQQLSGPEKAQENRGDPAF